ncbi:hypothetical protein C8F01DRAFT_367709 [Mycena amicta]|nr:hypothetical protein C8F01DRAFT_367709 [Mycena amicta]
MVKINHGTCDVLNGVQLRSSCRHLRFAVHLWPSPRRPHPGVSSLCSMRQQWQRHVGAIRVHRAVKPVRNQPYIGKDFLCRPRARKPIRRMVYGCATRRLHGRDAAPKPVLETTPRLRRRAQTTYPRYRDDDSDQGRTIDARSPFHRFTNHGSPPPSVPNLSTLAACRAQTSTFADLTPRPELNVGGYYMAQCTLRLRLSLTHTGS